MHMFSQEPYVYNSSNKFEGLSNEKKGLCILLAAFNSPNFPGDLLESWKFLKKFPDLLTVEYSLLEKLGIDRSYHDFHHTRWTDWLLSRTTLS